MRYRKTPKSRHSNHLSKKIF